ncbi:MAG: hypothetical protein NZ942_01355, partial [Candidatus Aenigmarchaeota archaeon]|nr:hypothetical protein [Candidatus Aenigmarchaeota archaeon]
QYSAYSVFKTTDKLLRILKKRIVSGNLSTSQVIEVSSLYLDTINKFWKEASVYYDKLANTPSTEWLSLNESIHEKQILVNRENNFVYTPKND